MANKKPPRTVEYRGETRKVFELAKTNGINPRTLCSRLDRGMPIEQALNEPIKQKKQGPKPLSKRNYGIRTKIINKLMETFFADPDRFEQWIQQEMDTDYANFYKTYVMPFLPKDQNALLDKGEEKATINIEFKGENAPKSVAVNEHIGG